MAKKMRSKKILDDEDFWDEIDSATKKKILEKAKREMAKDTVKKKITHQKRVKSSPSRPRVSTEAESVEISDKHKQPVHKKGEQSLHKISKPAIRKKSAEGKTPRGIITSYGTYILVEIDFKRIAPNNGHLRVNGVFEHIPESPASPVPSVSGRCWERSETKETDSLVEIPDIKLTETSAKNTTDATTSIGIDVTTKDFILNNIGFPDQHPDTSSVPVYRTAGLSERMSTSTVREAISPITYPTSDNHSVVNSIDDFLSMAKADSYKQDYQEHTDQSDKTVAGTYKYSYDYNHGHEAYSPQEASTSNWVYRQDDLHLSSYSSQTKGDYIPINKSRPSSTVSYNQDKLQISSYESKSSIPSTSSTSHITRKVSLVNTSLQRKTSVIRGDRKCYVCDKFQTNMKKYVASSHLGNAWWGVIADITCWKCRLYQNKESIGRCYGYFNQLQHSHLLLQRHQAFYRFLMEDLGCSTPHQLIALVIREGLCAWSTTPYTQEQMNFLNVIDTMMGAAPTMCRDPQNPTRLTDLTHWKTLAKILKYASLNGTITGPAIPAKNIAIIDTRSDITEFYQLTRYQGSLENHPRMQVSGRLTNFNIAITDVIDPALVNSQMFNTMMGDPRILITLGARPTADPNGTLTVHMGQNQYKHSPGIVAYGGVGLDISAGHSSMTNQVKILRTYMTAVHETGMALRVYTLGCHAELLKELETGVAKNQLLHYLNFQGTYNEALEYLLRFPNGYLGIGRKLLKPTPDMVEIILKVDTTRLLPESNTPYDPLEYAEISTPPEVAEVISCIANIKEMDRLSVTKTLRMNIHRVYKI